MNEVHLQRLLKDGQKKPGERMMKAEEQWEEEEVEGKPSRKSMSRLFGQHM